MDQKFSYHKIKKALLLTIIIVSPFLIYFSILIYSKGKHGIIKLPVIKEHPKITFLNMLKSEIEQYSNFITLVCFLDNSLKENEVILFRLHELILKKNAYPDFQLLSFVSDSSQLGLIIQKMEQWSKSSPTALNWKIYYMDSLSMHKNRVALSSEEEAIFYPNQVYIIDKDLNQRRGDIKKGAIQKSGYEALSIAVLKKELLDDVRIAIAEYRLALKKNNKYKIGDQ